MRAGTVTAVAKCPHRLSQPWSPYFYEEYGAIDGFAYRNAHNDEPALMLYERAKDALVCPDEDASRLDDPSVLQNVVSIMHRNNLTTLSA